ncbi:hypothetical protein FC83_GL003291 [Agrilactobacillus composti DSM 18527 = JCM 14202]|uniref:SpoVT-AbrB domain-containing protein n=1 Tax=Agrilactobacillus composti DSM 18527 = JCM 14202 TaxID=1423734 RepID=X0QNR9_9LACO|nr:AbrB/MazE/SpoVT family DNA-binding domain-containing protein [Agrilactobacillus composti]KRM33208.1 hypothetical protein FC83_GL003291 [Agrilactobacillus composti DSM 18527 = JCM 14202]GAF40280.1 hypothetical protein JCM14202_2173 [Agrilactobacillus composti DSM 18527 = JCM 14202]
MTNTESTKTVGQIGADLYVPLPEELVKKLHIKKGSALLVREDDGTIVLEPLSATQQRQQQVSSIIDKFMAEE